MFCELPTTLVVGFVEVCMLSACLTPQAGSRRLYSYPRKLQGFGDTSFLAPVPTPRLQKADGPSTGAPLPAYSVVQRPSSELPQIHFSYFPGIRVPTVIPPNCLPRIPIPFYLLGQNLRPYESILSVIQKLKRI